MYTNSGTGKDSGSLHTGDYFRPHCTTSLLTFMHNSKTDIFLCYLQTIIVTCTCKISGINKLEMFARLDITCLVMYVFAEI